MKLTRSNRELLKRLAAGDKLFTDTRRATAVVHHPDINSTGWRRVTFDTIRTLEGLKLIEVYDDFVKRGEYAIHYLRLTEAGLLAYGSYFGRDGEWRRWRYPESRRPQAVCYDCRRPYQSFEDVVLQDELWERINPTEHRGAGLLCANCIFERLHQLRVYEVAVR